MDVGACSRSPRMRLPAAWQATSGCFSSHRSCRRKSTDALSKRCSLSATRWPIWPGRSNASSRVRAARRWIARSNGIARSQHLHDRMPVRASRGYRSRRSGIASRPRCRITGFPCSPCTMARIAACASNAVRCCISTPASRPRSSRAARCSSRPRVTRTRSYVRKRKTDADVR